MPRQAAIDYIKSLDRGELACFFQEALQHLQEGTLAEGLTVFRLAECFAYAGPGSQPGDGPVIHLVASAITSRKDARVMLDQSGTCPACKAPVCCVAKLAVCPLCSSAVECT